MNWFDAVKWCNARSEKENRTPVYYTDAALTQVYRSDQIAPYVNWSASGYRLPTEAEWERAVRGGAWDLISVSKYCRVAARGYMSYAVTPSNTIGFRTVLRAP